MISATSPASTPANTERRISMNAEKPDRDRGEPHRRRHGREHARREDGELGDHAGEDRGRDRPHPHDDLGILVEPAREDDAEPAPHLVRQEARQDQRQIGGEFADSALIAAPRASDAPDRRRCRPRCRSTSGRARSASSANSGPSTRPKREREPVDQHAAVAQGRHQEGDRREEQQRRAHQRRQLGGEIEARDRRGRCAVSR